MHVCMCVRVRVWLRRMVARCPVSQHARISHPDESQGARLGRPIHRPELMSSGNPHLPGPDETPGPDNTPGPTHAQARAFAAEQARAAAREDDDIQTAAAAGQWFR
jgi:hypothetical protein